MQVFALFADAGGIRECPWFVWSWGAACRKPEGKGDRTQPPWRDPLSEERGGGGGVGPSHAAGVPQLVRAT